MDLTDKDRERFEKYVYPDPNTGCFLWGGAANDVGYGQIRIDGKARYAHRVAWLLDGREIPPGMHLLHKCDTPCCVNVDHLRVGDAMANMDDMARKGRGHRGGLPFGVRLQANGRFHAVVRVRYLNYHLGSYSTAAEAGAVALAARAQLRGAPSV